MNGNALATDGSVVHCEHGRRCISRSAGDADPELIVTHYHGKRLNSPNDVVVAADGSVWFTDPIFGLLTPSQGSVVEPELDHRSVYRFDSANRSLLRMADFERPNGLAFSPGGRTLYVSDTSLSLNEIPGPETGTKHEIQALDVAADGTLDGRRLFCHTGLGYPDGFKVDERGWVWTTAGTASTCTPLMAQGSDISPRHARRRAAPSGGGWWTPPVHRRDRHAARHLLGRLMQSISN